MKKVGYALPALAVLALFLAVTAVGLGVQAAASRGKVNALERQLAELQQSEQRKVAELVRWQAEQEERDRERAAREAPLWFVKDQANLERQQADDREEAQAEEIKRLHFENERLQALAQRLRRDLDLAEYEARARAALQLEAKERESQKRH